MAAQQDLFKPMMATVVAADSALLPQHQGEPSVSRVTSALFFVFGLSAWLLANALYTELPLLIHVLPEGNALGVWVTLAVQIANVLPFAWALLVPDPQEDDRDDLGGVGGQQSHGSPRNERSLGDRCTSWLHGWKPVFLLLLLNFCVPLALTFTWNLETQFFGNSHSTALLALAFLSGMASVSSAVIYWPFVAQYKSDCTTFLSTGEVSSGLLLGIISAAQNPGGSPPRFSGGVFFFLMALIAAASLVAFLLIRFTAYGRDALRYAPMDKFGSDSSLAPSAVLSSPVSSTADSVTVDGRVENRDASSSATSALLVDPKAASIIDQEHTPTLITSRFVFGHIWPLLLVQCSRAFLAFGVLSSIGSYACVRYPSGRLLLQWSTVLSNVLSPLASVANKWVNLRHRLRSLVAVMTASAAYTVFVSLFPTDPPFSTSAPALGWALVMLANLVFNITSAYCSTLVFLMVQDPASQPQLHDIYEAMRPAQRQAFVKIGARHTGLCIQVGAMAGALLMFLLLQTTNMWTD